ncbi:3-oxoacyl-[acyl-carrier protein] reductase [Richelia intracellularis]|nr:3-oxoacyl-[acyl-carrier protein] reductase [Richelia intracellularis]
MGFRRPAIANYFGCDSFGSTKYDIRIINNKSTRVVLTGKNVLDGIDL